MPATVSLAEVVEALALQSEMSSAFVNRQTGEILSCTEEEISLAEQGDDESAPEWMQPTLPKIRETLQGEPWLELPSKLELHEWEFMKRFADEQKNESVRAELRDSIHGAGAFRRFRAVVYRLGMEKQWHRFADQQIEEIAKEWLQENKIEFR